MKNKILAKMALNSWSSLLQLEDVRPLADTPDRLEDLSEDDIDLGIFDGTPYR